MYSKKVVLLLTSFSFIFCAFSQNLDLNIYGGVMNYGGDLQAKGFTLKQSNLTMGIGLAYKLHPQVAISATYLYGKIEADDKITNPSLANRNLSFTSSINEGSLRLEGDLWAVPEQKKFTPYAFAGVSVYSFNPYAYDSTGKQVFLQPLGTEGQGLVQYPDRKPYSLTQFAIPFGVGFKYALSPQVNVGAELSFRKLFTDYLDDVSTTYADTALLAAAHGPYSPYFSFRGDELKPPQDFTINAQRGNPKFNDNFYSVAIKLSFSLGNNNGGTIQSGNSKNILRQSGCPKVN